MKDAVGKNTEEGDLVAFSKPRSVNLNVGKVIKVTPKGFTVEYHVGKDDTRSINRGRAQVVKIG